MSGGEEPDPQRAVLIAEAAMAGRRVGAYSNAFWNAVATRMGLSRTEWACLDLLDAEGAMSAGQLAELLGLSTGAITGIVDRLIEQRLVTRERDPRDRRRVIIRQSDERLPELEAMFGPMVGALDTWLDSHTEEELRTYIRVSEGAIDVFRTLYHGMRGRGDDGPVPTT